MSSFSPGYSTAACTACPSGTTSPAPAAGTSLSDCKRYICSLRIRPTTFPLPLGAWLNLAEVQLFDRSGALVPRTALNFTLSSTHLLLSTFLSASFCNDGNTTTLVTLPGGAANTGGGQVCHSNVLDATPTLRVSFGCGLVPSKAVVWNRVDSADAARRINSFTLESVSSVGQVVSTFAFTGSAASYTVPLPQP